MSHRLAHPTVADVMEGIIAKIEAEADDDAAAVGLARLFDLADEPMFVRLGTHGSDLRQPRETRLSLRLGLLREESVGERSVRRTRVVTAYMRLVAQPATRRRELRVRLRRYLELALGRHRDRRARDEVRADRERELGRLGRERGDLVAARTRMARGEGGVRNYAEARPRAANGARAVAVRSGRRTMRVSELVGRMLGNLCRRAKEAG